MSAQPSSIRPKGPPASFKEALYFQRMSGANDVIPEEYTPKKKQAPASNNEMHILDEKVYSDLQFVLTKKLNDSTKSLGRRSGGARSK